jgi:hypothetical protein
MAKKRKKAAKTSKKKTKKAAPAKKKGMVKAKKKSAKKTAKKATKKTAPKKKAARKAAPKAASMAAPKARGLAADGFGADDAELRRPGRGQLGGGSFASANMRRAVAGRRPPVMLTDNAEIRPSAVSKSLPRPGYDRAS